VQENYLLVEPVHVFGSGRCVMFYRECAWALR